MFADDFTTFSGLSLSYSFVIFGEDFGEATNAEKGVIISDYFGWFSDYCNFVAAAAESKKSIFFGVIPNESFENCVYASSPAPATTPELFFAFEGVYAPPKRRLPSL